jgi:putative protein kinase ArgK-like GTPase of G3E family
MKKVIKKYGNSLVIVFTKEEADIYHIKQGDIIDITDIVVIKSRRLKNARKNKKEAEGYL